ncbi:MAG: tetratricopeptide repeat protein [Polyangiaceae bacterium]
MFTVECPGCSATYQVDERRVPATGLRMRCPKCSTAFVVEKPSTDAKATAEVDLPAQVDKPGPVAAAKKAPEPSNVNGKPPPATGVGAKPPAPSALAGKPQAPSNVAGKAPVATGVGAKPPAPSALAGKPQAPSNVAGKAPATTGVGAKPPAPSALAGKPQAPSTVAGKAPAANGPAAKAPIPAGAAPRAPEFASALESASNESRSHNVDDEIALPATKETRVKVPPAAPVPRVAAASVPDVEERDSLLPAAAPIKSQFDGKITARGATKAPAMPAAPSAREPFGDGDIDIALPVAKTAPERSRNIFQPTPHQPKSQDAGGRGDSGVAFGESRGRGAGQVHGMTPPQSLGADIASRNLPTEPRLPIATPYDAHTMDSDLPAALGSKPMASRGARKPVEVQPPGGHSEDFSDLELDLPSLSNAKNSVASVQRSELPALAPVQRRSYGEIELDLPSPAAGERAPSRPKSIAPLSDDFEFDLPSPVQAQKGDSGGRRIGANATVDDLPDVPGVFGGAELPALDVGLPAITSSGMALPSLPGSTGAMTKTLQGTGSMAPPKVESVPPMATSIPPSDIPELDLGWGGTGGSIPPLRTPTSSGSFASSIPPATSSKGVGSSADPRISSGIVGMELLSPNTVTFGRALEEGSADSIPPALGSGASTSRARLGEAPELTLPVSPATSGNPARGVSPSSPSSYRARASSYPAGAGGTSYGEVALDGVDETVPVETLTAEVGRSSLASGEALEFGSLPHGAPEVARAVSAATAAVAVRDGGSERSIAPPAKTRKLRRVAIALGSLGIILGSALSLVPDIGIFGSHFVVDQIHRKEHLALVQRLAGQGRELLLRDDFRGVTEMIQKLDVARRDQERLKELAAYGAYFAFAMELRHGGLSAPAARAKVALTELGERPELAYWRLAQSARAAVEGNLALARNHLQSALSREPRDASVRVLQAEILLLERRAGDALPEWQSAEKLEASARTAYGLARTQFALGRFNEAQASAELAQSRNSSHVGAMLLRARMALEARHESNEAERLVNEALKLESAASTADFVQAKTLSGDVHLLHSRISLAETSYQEAIQRSPKSGAALRGLGETLFRAGRYSESLARFEAAIQAEPDNVDAAVGAAKAELSLERIRDAGAHLGRLRQANPKNYAVNYWYARANEAGGNRDEAEKAYEAAIETGGIDPLVVDAYVGLALLKSQQGRPEEAQSVLARAQEKLPKVPRIYEAMGQLALSEGRYAAATEQFKRALELEPNDVGFKFRLGVAHRKNRDFEAAAKCFDEVAAVDRDYPGLALERGQLYESSGQTEEALRAFESALAKAPNNPDLMLRVGCGKVSAGRPEQAEELLKKVLEQRQNSAETHHCLGRAQLLEGSNLAVALRTLERAVELDPHRAEYHLYVGWAANEIGRVSQAEQSLRKALELDQGLGDAYWQRGILRYRQSAVKNAVADFTRALELRPGRYEAHAALADAYFDLGLEAKALEQLKLATSAQPDNAAWAFRYGKLLQVAHRDAEAKVQLERAIELAEKLTSLPKWAWEAHHLLARAIGPHPAAIVHWVKFLELAPRDNAYRSEAIQALAKLGHPWTKD